MLVIRRLFGTGTNCIAPSGLPLLLCLFPGLAPWAFLSRPFGASFAPETRLGLVRLDGRRHGWDNISMARTSRALLLAHRCRIHVFVARVPEAIRAFRGIGGSGAHAQVLSLLWVAGLLETFGGVLIILGLFTCPVAFI